VREPSASHLALAKLCAHPFTSGIKWPWEEQGDAGRFGDRVHLGCEALETGEAVYPAIYAYLSDEECRKLDWCVEGARELLALTPGLVDVEVELDLRYHVETGAVRRAAPGESKRPGEWTVKIDWVALTGDTVLVRDWKTGKQKHLDKARENPQVRLGAVAAARYFGVKRARVELVHLEEDGHMIDGADFDRLELAAIASELRALRRSLTGGPTPPTPGAHCTTHFCKLRGVCSATLSALATAQPVGERFSIEIRDAEHARWTLERIPAVEAAIDAIKKAVKEYARKGPIPMAGGEVYGWRESSERKVDVDTPERVEALRQVLGDLVDVAVVRPAPKVTLGSIDEAARQLAASRGAKRGAKTSIAREALASLEAAGGLRVDTFEKCESFRPKASAAKEESA
jgi:hypothetical protein